MDLDPVALVRLGDGVVLLAGQFQVGGLFHQGGIRIREVIPFLTGGMQQDGFQLCPLVGDPTVGPERADFLAVASLARRPSFTAVGGRKLESVIHGISFL